MVDRTDSAAEDRLPAGEQLAAGRVGRAHGLDGSFYVTGARPRLLELGTAVTIAGRTAAIVRRAGTDQRPIVRVHGVDDRDGAEALRGQTLTVAAARCARSWERANGGRTSWRAAWCSTGSVGRHGHAPARAALVRGLEVREMPRSPVDAPEPLLVPMVTDAIRHVDVAPRRDRGEHGLHRRRGRSRAMEIDIFTLFPEWFTWITEQRHVAQRASLPAADRVRELPRAHAARRGQVDDTPFGGGAGMVLRVDVLDSALRARYGVDPVGPARAAPGDRADPGRAAARRRARRRAGGRARADAAVRALRGLRRAHHRALRQRVRSRSGATSWPAASWPRWSCATPSCASCRARSGTSESAVEESFSAALEGRPEYPHYTRPAEYRGWRGARGAAVRSSRADRGLAARAQPRTGAAHADRPLPLLTAPARSIADRDP